MKEFSGEFESFVLSTRPITCIAIRLRDLYERLWSEMENKLWITVLFF